jgi:hypothetical protein
VTAQPQAEEVEALHLMSHGEAAMEVAEIRWLCETLSWSSGLKNETLQIVGSLVISATMMLMKVAAPMKWLRAVAVHPQTWRRSEGQASRHPSQRRQQPAVTATQTTLDEVAAGTTPSRRTVQVMMHRFEGSHRLSTEVLMLHHDGARFEGPHHHPSTEVAMLLLHHGGSSHHRLTAKTRLSTTVEKRSWS